MVATTDRIVRVLSPVLGVLSHVRYAMRPPEIRDHTPYTCDNEQLKREPFDGHSSAQSALERVSDSGFSVFRHS